jgi:diguanylate cyclase (GGDEF)-like protein
MFDGSRNIILRSALIGLLSSILIILIVSMMVISYNKRLETLSTIDSLTGLLNRREFSRLLQISYYRKKRYRVPVSVIIIDLDNFKNINDTKGHPAGDKVLIQISDFFRTTKRTDDVLSRWGGDEFMLLLESNINESRLLAKRLHEENRKTDSTITLSIGLAQLKTGESIDSLIGRVDSALYTAKNNGRDQTAEAV